MKKHALKRFQAWAAVIACLSLSAVLWTEERFQARLLIEGGAISDRASKIEIWVEDYTKTEEVLQLLEILYKGGYEPFMSAFRGMNKGIIRPIGGRGVKITIHAAQNIQTDKGRKVLLFAERKGWDADARQKIDRRFSFMVIELNINNKGKGEGKIYEQANIKLTSQGTIEIESYNSPPQQLWGVKVLK